MRLIDTDKFIECLNSQKDCAEYEKCFNKYLIREMIKTFPTVEINYITHAHWMIVRRLYGNKSDLTATCSNCDSEFVCASIYDTKDYKYCPNCGAKMDEEEQ